MTDFELLGGAAKLRAVIADFTKRVFDDVMIGFLFDGKPKARITEMEYRFAAEHLGGPVAYNGRSIRAAHARSPILGGHFTRRRTILANTLRDHHVPTDVVDRWLAHVDSLSEQVLGTDNAVTDCNDSTVNARFESATEPGGLMGSTTLPMASKRAVVAPHADE